MVLYVQVEHTGVEVAIIFLRQDQASSSRGYLRRRAHVSPKNPDEVVVNDRYGQLRFKKV